MDERIWADDCTDDDSAHRNLPQKHLPRKVRNFEARRQKISWFNVCLSFLYVFNEPCGVRIGHLSCKVLPRNYSLSWSVCLSSFILRTTGCIHERESTRYTKSLAIIHTHGRGCSFFVLRLSHRSRPISVFYRLSAHTEKTRTCSRTRTRTRTRRTHGFAL